MLLKKNIIPVFFLIITNLILAQSDTSNINLIYNSVDNNKYTVIEYYANQFDVFYNIEIKDFKSRTEYTLNDKKISSVKYLSYKKAYDDYVSKREKSHYYKKYSKDSVLLFEGLYKAPELPIGDYKAYFDDGCLKRKGAYDKKSRKDGLWYFYNKKNELLYKENYKKGVLLNE